jgi:L-ribulose-5-phosphate 4-epimerase
VSELAHEQLRVRTFEANRAIVRAGLVALTFGNVSAVDREAGVLAIKPSGVPYDELAPAAMVLVDLDSGRPLDAAAPRPSSDTATHLVLYRAFEAIGGIVHTHSTAATSWAQAARAIPCLGTTHADHFRGAVPVTRQLTAAEIRGAYERETGAVIVETFAGAGLDPLATPGVLVASHGPFAWGADVDGAVENAIALEVVAELALRTLTLGAGGKAIADELAERHHARKHGPTAYYGQQRAAGGG